MDSFSTKRPTAFAGLFALAILFASSDVFAGLVFLFPDDLDVSRVERVRAVPEGLEVTMHPEGGRTIPIDPALIPDLARWADGQSDSIAVISIDGATAPGGERYAPDWIPRTLVEELISLDVFAHEIACGALSADEKVHPLLRAKRRGSFPDKRHLELLDTKTSPEGLWYQHASSLRVAPPRCVGELTLQVVADENGVLALRPSSWIHVSTEIWYRGIDVAPPWLQWAMRLPYAELKTSMETRWPQYRQAFPELDRLSSFVEIVGLLRALRMRGTSVDLGLERAIAGSGSPPDRPASQLRRTFVNDEPWSKRSVSWVGPSIDSIAEANLALDLVIRGLDVAPYDPARWLLQIPEIAERSPAIASKLCLAQLLGRSEPPNDSLIVQCLDAMRGFPSALRLRLYALSLIGGRLDQPGDDASKAVRAGWRSALKELSTSTNCEDPPPDLLDAEDAIQNVYSTGLIHELDALGEDQVRSVACIHLRRGLADSVGRELAFRHAHYRFLGYLAGRTSDPETTTLIRRYRARLAEKMGIEP